MQTGATQIQTAHTTGAGKVATAITSAFATFDGKMGCCDKPVKLDSSSTKVIQKAAEKTEVKTPATVTEGMQRTEVGYTEHNGEIIEEVKVIASRTETVAESFGHFTTSLKDLFDSNTEGGFLEKMGNIFSEGSNVFKTLFNTLTTKISTAFANMGGGEGGGFLSGLFRMFIGFFTGGALEVVLLLREDTEESLLDQKQCLAEFSGQAEYPS